MRSGRLEAPSLIDILLRRGLIFADKVVLCVLAEPDGELGEFLTQTRHGLLVHVCLSDELGKRHCLELALSQTRRLEWTYPSGGTSVQVHRYRRQTCACLPRQPSPTPCESHGTGDAQSYGEISRVRDTKSKQKTYRYSKIRLKDFSKYSRSPATTSSRMSMFAEPSSLFGRS